MIPSELFTQQQVSSLTGSNFCRFIKNHLLNKPTRVQIVFSAAYLLLGSLGKEFFMKTCNNMGLTIPSLVWTQGLSRSSVSSAETFPELRPNLPNDKFLKLLLPSPRLNDILDFLGFIGLDSTSISVSILLLATTSLAMLLRQKGQAGILVVLVKETGLL